MCLYNSSGVTEIEIWPIISIFMENNLAELFPVEVFIEL